MVENDQNHELHDITFQHGFCSSRIVPILARCPLRLCSRKLQLIFDTGIEGALANVVDLLHEAGPEHLDMFVMQRQTLEFFESDTLLASNTGLRVLDMWDEAIVDPHVEEEEASFLSRNRHLCTGWLVESRRFCQRMSICKR